MKTTDSRYHKNRNNVRFAQEKSDAIRIFSWAATPPSAPSGVLFPISKVKNRCPRVRKSPDEALPASIILLPDMFSMVY
jgi:hypothetical protein